MLTCVGKCHGKRSNKTCTYLLFHLAPERLFYRALLDLDGLGTLVLSRALALLCLHFSQLLGKLRVLPSANASAASLIGLVGGTRFACSLLLSLSPPTHACTHAQGARHTSAFTAISDLHQRSQPSPPPPQEPLDPWQSKSDTALCGTKWAKAALLPGAL